jgi:hypothetical protein
VVYYGAQRFWIIIFWNMIHDRCIHHAFHKVSLEAFLTLFIHKPKLQHISMFEIHMDPKLHGFLKEKFLYAPCKVIQPGMLIYKWLYEPLVMKQIHYKSNTCTYLEKWPLRAQIWFDKAWVFSFSLLFGLGWLAKKPSSCPSPKRILPRLME